MSNIIGDFKLFFIIMEVLDLDKDDIYGEIGCGGGALLKMALARAGQGTARTSNPARPVTRRRKIFIPTLVLSRSLLCPNYISGSISGRFLGSFPGLFLQVGLRLQIGLL